MVALLAARRRPDLVDRLVLIGQYYNSSGKVPGSHALPVENPEVVNPLLLWFLARATPISRWRGAGTGGCRPR